MSARGLNKISNCVKLLKPPIVNQQCIFYKFECELCDAGYVGFTRRHLHQRVEEHKNSSSSIGKHFRDKHSSTPKDLTKNFSVLFCTHKFDCLSIALLFFFVGFYCPFTLPNYYTSYMHIYIHAYIHICFNFIIYLIMTEVRSKRRFSSYRWCLS